MTKKEAISVLISTDSKITHRYFTDDEYIQGITNENGNRVLQDENGYQFSFEEFFRWRLDSCWDTDWQILT